MMLSLTRYIFFLIDDACEDIMDIGGVVIYTILMRTFMNLFMQKDFGKRHQDASTANVNVGEKQGKPNVCLISHYLYWDPLISDVADLIPLHYRRNDVYLGERH